MKIMLTLALCLTLLTYGVAQQPLNDAIKALTLQTNPQHVKQTAVILIKTHQVNDRETLDIIDGITALAFLKAAEFKTFSAYIKKIRNPFNQTSYLNMAVAHLLKNNIHLVEAERLAKKTVLRYESYKNNPNARPSEFPVEQWNRFINMAASLYYESYAHALYLNRKPDMALPYFEKAMELTASEFVSAQTLSLYTQLLIANNKTEKAYTILHERVKTGTANVEMKAQLLQLLQQKNGNEQTAIRYIDSLELGLRENYRGMIAKKMINDKDAPKFELSTLRGEKLNLASLKGKTVVLDFWATWCAPCLAAMPTMVSLQKKYNDVVFLFIATQESPENITQRITDFLKKNDYTITVLLDQPSTQHAKVFEVANRYGVKGIPAKFVIDKHGKLRFASSGFDTNEALFLEMEAMLALVNTP